MTGAGQVIALREELGTSDTTTKLHALIGCLSEAATLRSTLHSSRGTHLPLSHHELRYFVQCFVGWRTQHFVQCAKPVICLTLYYAPAYYFK